jgi:hypothetical protein
MIARIAAAGLMATTMACATPAPPEPGVPDHGGGGSCDAAPARHLIGREATQALATEAIRLSGARRLRWLPPGAIMTMEYSPDRLNIEYDAGMRVTAIRCG